MAGIPAHPRSGAMLRDVRALKARGLSNEEVAAKLRMSRSTLQRILRDTNGGTTPVRGGRR